MPPKIKITKEDIINAAVGIVKKEGEQGLNARAVASALSCSTQPIFSNYPTMDSLRKDVVRACYNVYEEYTVRELAREEYVTYKATGMAYIEFAKAERNLFRMLFMRDRRAENEEEDVFADKMDSIYEMISRNSGLDFEKSKLFHFEMWTVVHGLAVMCATSYQPIEREFASNVISDIYWSLLRSFKEKDGEKDNRN